MSFEDFINDAKNYVVKNLNVERLVMKAQERSQYSRIDWENEEGDVVASVSAHKWTNVKEKAGKYYRYLHNHFTIYLRTIVNGVPKMVSSVSWVHSQDAGKNQMQINDMDLVFKGSGRLMLRDKSQFKFHELYIEDGQIKTKELDISEIRFANETSKEVTAEGHDI